MAGEKSTPWPSIWAATGFSFFAAVQFSIYFGSTYPYLQSLDPHSTVNFYGLVVASYSLGQTVGAPAIGWWSSRLDGIKIPISLCLALSFLGNLIYILAQASTDYAKYFLLIARFVVGLGSCNISILKGYAAMASNSKDRARAIALLTGGISLGATTGPLLQSAFTPIGETGWKIAGRVHLSMYTSPAFVACAVNFLGTLFLWFVFKETYAGLAPREVNKKKAKGDERKEDVPGLPAYDKPAVFLCCLTLFAQRFTFTNIETLASPLSITMFSWSNEETVKYIGLAHGALSFIAFLVYLAFFVGRLDKYINNRNQTIVALGGLIIFHLATFSWPFLGGSLPKYNSDESNSTQPGCDVAKYNWCDSVAPVNPWVFYLAYIIFIGICFPSVSITLNTLFSKIIGPRNMNTEQGFLYMTGGIARLIGPLVISALYSQFGPQYAWILEILVLIIIIAAWIAMYRRMVPLIVPSEVWNSVRSKKSRASVITEVLLEEEIEEMERDRRSSRVLSVSGE
ncbi:unnamed protein product [Bursaphelenchus xylophilus]|uniref:(pine wood nematode) hypothetical protein n=1 Tax=Bursaphelenchus xylophilus TaxID=6326 RepID=A0A1I7SL18_BURXY|nr:unnamed protein product [Bursaphelenchus xylophilus]CAG9129336.1 unnamed protein product [Bursaphelenchus xylophilus]